jgi:hypothetical protein
MLIDLNIVNYRNYLLESKRYVQITGLAVNRALIC